MDWKEKFFQYNLYNINTFKLCYFVKYHLCKCLQNSVNVLPLPAGATLANAVYGGGADTIGCPAKDRV